MTDLSVACAGTERRAVLRVIHHVDAAGHVIGVDLEPLQDAPHIEALGAAWQHARRCHPWIVDDNTAAKLAEARRIALKQINHLMTTAGEALAVMRGVEHDAVHRLRDALTDLRGYLPALHGDLPAADESNGVLRRAG